MLHNQLAGTEQGPRAYLRTALFLLCMLLSIPAANEVGLPFDTAICISHVRYLEIYNENRGGMPVRIERLGVNAWFTWADGYPSCPQPVYAGFIAYREPSDTVLGISPGLWQVWDESSGQPKQHLIYDKRYCNCSVDTCSLDGYPRFNNENMEYRIYEHSLRVDTIYMAVRDVTMDSLWLRFDTTSFFGDTAVWVGTLGRGGNRRGPGMQRRRRRVLSVKVEPCPGPARCFYDIRGRKATVRRPRGVLITVPKSSGE